MAVTKLPQTRDRETQVFDLRIDLRNSLVALGDYVNVLRHLREAEALADRLGDRTRQALVGSNLASAFLFTNQYEPGLRAAQRALQLATSTGDLLSVRRARYGVGQLLWALGDYVGA